jgi:hypothetical protein
VPDAALVDGEWDAANQPRFRDSVTDCGPTVGLWNRAARRWIPGSVRSNGRVVLPQSDYIVEWQRSIESPPGTLARGRWITTLTISDAPEMAEFLRVTWRILSKLTTNRLRCVSCPDPRTPERRFRAGATAIRRAQAGELALVADSLRLARRSTEPRRRFLDPFKV